MWSFTLVEQDGQTRLLSRNRIRSPQAGPIGRAFNTAIMEPGSLVMEHKMLHGFKERAERTLDVDRSTVAGHRLQTAPTR